MTDKLRDELEKLLVVYDDACNEFVASTPNPSARDAEVRRYLLAFTDLYEAALAATADAPPKQMYGFHLHFEPDAPKALKRFIEIAGGCCYEDEFTSEDFRQFRDGLSAVGIDLREISTWTVSQATVVL